MTNPTGLCKCGCGQRTGLSLFTRTALGRRAGEPADYVRGHNATHQKTRIDPFAGRTVAGENGCIEWTGARLPSGYGHLHWMGDLHRAHRLRWLLEHGPIPDGMYVCHSCDNRPCVNIEHLFLGTAADNNRDCVAKGRWRTGPRRRVSDGI
jgi:hypothetical protein